MPSGPGWATLLSGHRASPPDFGFCILIFWHRAQRHFRFLWKMWPFSSFIVTLHLLQVIAERPHFHLI
jgi:hypothetical protein